MSDRPSEPSRLSVSLASDARARARFLRFTASDTAFRAVLPILGAGVAIRASRDASGSYSVGAVANSPTATRWLNDVLVAYARLDISPEGRVVYVLYSGVSVDKVVERVLDAGEFLLRLRYQEESADFGPGTSVNMFWWSAALNFGDWIGPLLVNRITGRQPVQAARNTGGGARVLYSVGSILGWVKSGRVDVWGSGLIRPLSPEDVEERSALKGVRIYAVRGRLTRNELEMKLGWSVPEVFGDPALLLPDVIPTSARHHGRVACVPHYIHRAQLVAGSGSNVRIVDVRDDVYDVVAEISGASAVISSSLHGLIVAQAYGVPWVWLEVVDQQLRGGEFKFEDFFSCLDRDSVSHARVTSAELGSLDFEALAATAALPQSMYDAAALRAALPVAPIAAPVEMALP